MSSLPGSSVPSPSLPSSSNFRPAFSDFGPPSMGFVQVCYSSHNNQHGRRTSEANRWINQPVCAGAANQLRWPSGLYVWRPGVNKKAVELKHRCLSIQYLLRYARKWKGFFSEEVGWRCLLARKYIFFIPFSKKGIEMCFSLWCEFHPHVTMEI